jgi:O-antigen biosynthesis protein
LTHAGGEMTALLRGKLEIFEPGWLKEMVSCFDYGNVGIVRSNVFYAKRAFRFLDSYFRMGNPGARCLLEGDEDFPGPIGRPLVRQSLSTVDGECLLISRETIERIINIVDEKSALSHTDVDLSIRVRRAGLRVIWTPFAALLRYESVTERRKRLRRKHDESRSLDEESLTDFATSPWYSSCRRTSEWALLAHLPDAR